MVVYYILNKISLYFAKASTCTVQNFNNSQKKKKRNKKLRQIIMKLIFY